LNVVHLAGTKGKGSTAAMIAAVLSAAGYRTGLYTSPHLDRVEERIRIDGAEIPADGFVELVNRLRPVVAELDEEAGQELLGSQGPTYFEILTAMALVYFADHHVDWAVLEVGLGGRLDSTNVCHPAVSVITSISFDHTKQLGSTLAEIAGEKAGIIKPGVPVVSGVVQDEPREVIRQMAAQHGCRLIERTIDFDAQYQPVRSEGPGDTLESSPRARIDFSVRLPRREYTLCNLELSLLGEHQAANAAVALAALEELREQGLHVDDKDVRRGMAGIVWPARVEMVGTRPTVILDSAHNVASILALLTTLEQSFTARRRLAVFATTRDKDVRGMLERLLPAFDSVILTRYQCNPRGVPVEELVQIAKELQAANYAACELSETAWKMARDVATADDLIVITGSFFIAAELGAAIRQKKKTER
jgi:dihydrofolate synthase/folylpolyglutamate synthase